MMEPQPGTEPLVELSFYGRKLRNMDFFSKSDPFVVVYVGNQQSIEESQFEMVGRTETVWDNLNPDFVSKFYLERSRMEREKSRLLLQFYDQDSKEVEELTPEYLKQQDFIGQVSFNVEEVGIWAPTGRAAAAESLTEHATSPCPHVCLESF